MSTRHETVPTYTSFAFAHLQTVVPTRRRDARSCGMVREQTNFVTHAFRRIILSIPAGKVSTYGRVAAAAGYPLYHRAVARLLRTDPPTISHGTGCSAPAVRSNFVTRLRKNREHG